MANLTTHLYQPALFALKTKQESHTNPSQQQSFFPSFSLATEKNLPRKSDNMLKSISNQSNTVLPKKAYGLQLQQQIVVFW